MTGPTVELTDNVVYRAGRVRGLPAQVAHLALAAYIGHAESGVDGPVLLPLGDAIVLRNHLRQVGRRTRLLATFESAIAGAVAAADVAIPEWLWPGESVAQVTVAYGMVVDDPARRVIDRCDFAAGTVQVVHNGVTREFANRDGRWVCAGGGAVTELHPLGSEVGVQLRVAEIAGALRNAAKSVTANVSADALRDTARMVEAVADRLHEVCRDVVNLDRDEP